MSTTQNTRSFTAFAFLADKLSQGGDLVSGLIPLFAPVIAPLAGQRFEAGKLSDLIAEYYGMEIHPYAVEDIAPRLCEQGLLEQNKINKNLIEYYYKKVDDPLNEVKDTLVEEVSNRFAKFAQPQLSILKVKLDDATLKSALLTRLKKAEFFGALLKTTNGNTSPSNTNHWQGSSPTSYEHDNHEAQLDVLVASFLLNAYESDQNLYELLIKFTTGALIAEVILDFRHPSNLKDLKGVQVFLDTPFLMSLFDFGSKLSTTYADKLYHQLKKSGATLATFRHSIEEFRDNIEAVLNAKKEGWAYGETATRLVDPSFKIYATTFLPMLEQKIREKGIEIAAQPSANVYRFFTLEEEKELTTRINWHHSLQARERDAQSVAQIMRLRAGKTVGFSNIQACGTLFLTKNGKLVSITEKALLDSNRLHKREVPPCLTDRYFAGLLWVMFGGERDGLPEHRLLSNCARAVNSGVGVIAKMHEVLTHTSPEHAEHFKALMTSERCSQYFMRITLGDPLLITDENSRELYHKVELITGEKITKQKDEEIAQIKKTHEEELKESANKISHEKEQEKKLLEEQILKQADQQSRELALAQQESIRHSFEAKETQKNLDAERQLKAKQQQTIINEALQLGRSHRRSIKILTVLISTIVFISLNLFDKYFLANLETGSLLLKLSLPLYLIILVIQFILSFWIIPDKLFSAYAEKQQLKTTQNYLNKFGLVDLLTQYEIDWNKGVTIQAPEK